MANTLKFKRGLLAGLPAAAEGEPLFTTDTADLYIGTSTGTQKFQKFIASGATTQILRGDGSLFTFPLTISSPTNGQVLKYNGTAWVNDSDAGITGSGSSGQVAYFTGATTQAGNNNLFWDISNARLGVGTNVPSTSLHVVGQITGNSFIPTSATIPVNGMYLPNTNTIAFSTNTQQKLILDATGNLGLGVVLKSWGVGSSAFELGNGGIWKSGSRSVDWIVNGYNNGTNYIYNVSAAATFYRQFDGSHQFWNAPSGTAGNAITFTQAMTLTAAGRLLLGTTSEASNILEVVGDTRFSPTGTSLTITGTSNFSILTANQALIFRSSGSTAGRLYKSFDNTTPLTGTIGNNVNINGTITFSPTSGTATYTGLSLTDTINQTGGANGITRGLYINPTLTAAADFRAIETSNNTGWSYYGAGSANSYFGGNLAVGTTTTTNRLEVWGSGNTAARIVGQSAGTASLILSSGGVTAYSIKSGNADSSLRIDQDGSDRLILASGGSLGLGISPGSRFHVDAAAGASHIRISESGTTRGFVGGANGIIATITNYFAVRGEAGLILSGQGNNINFAIHASTGNILINNGINDTGEKFQVTGTAKITGTTTFNSFVTITRGQDASVTNLNINSGVTPVSAFQINTDQPNLRSIVTSRNGYSLALATNDTNRLTIDTSGAATFSTSVTVSSGSALTGFFLNAGVSQLTRLQRGTAVTILSDNYNAFSPQSQDNTSIPSWQIRMGGGSGADFFRLERSPAGSTTMTALLAITSTNFTLADAIDIGIGTTTGTKIGTATSQKIGFWNAAPIVQPTTGVAAATRVPGGGATITDLDTFDGYTVNQIVKALRNTGLLA